MGDSGQEMEVTSAAGIDAWLRGGGLVIAASERAARALAAAFHRARRAEGLIAWPAPEIRDWTSFSRCVAGPEPGRPPDPEQHSGRGVVDGYCASERAGNRSA